MITRWALMVAGCATALTLAGCGGSDAPAADASAGTASASAVAEAGVQVLLDAQRLTALDQPITYPRKGAAEVTSAFVTLEPGQETGWRKHKVPVFVHVLEGTLSVEYDAGVTKQYGAGSTFMQAQGVWYDASNASDIPVRMLTVYFGAKGVKNTVERPS